MNRLGQWMADYRWAMNVMRARRWRRRLGFSQRQYFDDALRPPIKPTEVPARVIAYPDAFYHTTVDDLLRAIRRSAEVADLHRLGYSETEARSMMKQSD